MRCVPCFVASLLVWASLVACTQEAVPPQKEPAPSLAALLGGTTTAGYEFADKARTFSFPADHGPHPGFRNEWWYVTGNVDATDGRRFGYELTFFRVALLPGTGEFDSEWRARQIYIAHFAISDIASERFFTAEQFARGAAGLAGAQFDPPRVWLHDWSLRHRPVPDQAANWQLRAATEQFAIDLNLEELKAPVLQGDAGLSVKSAEEGNASYYYSLPRLRTSGRLQVAGTEFEVSGLSWMDREWSTSALGARQDGWDWFALQLDDGSDLMFYQLRRDDGSVDTASAGSLVRPDGAVMPLSQSDVTIEVLDEWESPLGDRYPHGWQLRIPSLSIDLRIKPAMADQELDTFVRYWEGAVDVVGNHGGTPTSGRGYVELTGYAGAGVAE